MKNGLKPNDGPLHLDHNDKHFLSGIKKRLQAAHIIALCASEIMERRELQRKSMEEAEKFKFKSN